MLKFGAVAKLVNAADWKSVDPGSIPGHPTKKALLIKVELISPIAGRDKCPETKYLMFNKGK